MFWHRVRADGLLRNHRKLYMAVVYLGNISGLSFGPHVLCLFWQYQHSLFSLTSWAPPFYLALWVGSSLLTQMLTFQTTFYGHWDQPSFILNRWGRRLDTPPTRVGLEFISILKTGRFCTKCVGQWEEMAVHWWDGHMLWPAAIGLSFNFSDFPLIQSSLASSRNKLFHGLKWHPNDWNLTSNKKGTGTTRF